MISIYILIAIVCAVLLFIMVAAGDFGADADFDVDLDVDADIDIGHGDFGGTGISPLSVPILLVFGTGFGSVGAILEVLEVDKLIVPVVATAISALITAVTFVVMVKVFIKTQGSTAVGMKDLVGKEGMTSIPIKKGEPGQIVVTTEVRGRIQASAVADQDIPTNTLIKVIGLSGDSVKVEMIKKEG